MAVEGQRIPTYDEFIRLISQDKYKDREYLEVVLVPAVEGG